jgi:myo-inositol-1(or 4)-monophosphatase
VDDERVLGLLNEVADGISGALGDLDDWGLAGTRPGQYRSDLAADAVAVELLTAGGLGVLSEESGRHRPDADIVVVVDPVDGSTNASHRIPWYATSLCAVAASGPAAAVVLNLASGHRFTAMRGRGARLDGEIIRTGRCRDIGASLIGLSGYPPHHLGWRQFRALGSVALDLCAVAGGVLDGYVDCSVDAHGSWDYLGALLVCQEAGAVVADASGRGLVVLEHDARRTPVAAATPALLEALLAARRGITPA